MIRDIIEKHNVIDVCNGETKIDGDKLAADLTAHMESEMMEFAVYLHDECYYAENGLWGVLRERDSTRYTLSELLHQFQAETRKPS